MPRMMVETIIGSRPKKMCGANCPVTQVPPNASGQAWGSTGRCQERARRTHSRATAWCALILGAGGRMIEIAKEETHEPDPFHQSARAEQAARLYPCGRGHRAGADRLYRRSTRG